VLNVGHGMVFKNAILEINSAKLSRRLYLKFILTTSPFLSKPSSGTLMLSNKSSKISLKISCCSISV